MNTPSPQKQSDGLEDYSLEEAFAHLRAIASGSEIGRQSIDVIDRALADYRLAKPLEPSAGKWSVGDSVLDPLTHKFLCPVIHQSNVWAYGYSENKEEAKASAIEIVNALNNVPSKDPKIEAEKCQHSIAKILAYDGSWHCFDCRTTWHKQSDLPKHVQDALNKEGGK
jgi:hypothetical protein